MKNPLTKTMVHELNMIAQDDFIRVLTMLDGINLALGTNYGLLNKRVVYFDDNTSVASRYATAHDAWANAEDK